jgi:hypothetical protein
VVAEHDHARMPRDRVNAAGGRAASQMGEAEEPHPGASGVIELAMFEFLTGLRI